MRTLAPEDPRSRIQQALAAAEAGQFGKAETLADEAIERSGGSCAMVVLAARILIDARRPVDAWRMAGRARKADPTNAMANAYGALALLAQGDYARAAGMLHKKEVPDSGGFQTRLLLETELALSRIRREPPALDAPIELEPADFRIAPVLSWFQDWWYARKDKRRLARARRLTERGRAVAGWLLVSEEWAVDSRFTLGEGDMMAFARPCHEQLLARAEQAKRLSTADALQLAEVAALVGDFETARKQLHHLRQGRHGRDVRLQVDLITGLVQFWNDQTDAAVTSLESVVKIDREATLAHYFLGLAHLRQEKFVKARRALAHLCRYEPWRGTQTLLALRDELNAAFDGES